MTETMTSGSGAAPPAANVIVRLIGVLFSPKDTFAAIAARPRWLTAMAVVIVVMGATQFALLSTDVGKQLALEQNVAATEAFITVTDEMYAQMEAGMENARYTGPIFLLFGIPLISAISSGILHMMFGLIGGGQGTFKQMYAISAHTSIISALQLIFTTVVTLAAAKPAGANLSVFAPTLEETTFVYRFLSAIDVFYVWSTFVTAIGVAVLYKKRTGTVAIVLFGIYLVIALIIAFARSGS